LTLRFPSILFLVSFVSGCVTPQSAPENGAFFQDSFESKSLSSSFTVIAGQTNIKRKGENSYAVLQSDSKETVGLLFGPAFSSGLRLEARFLAEDGEKSPTFAVGLNGLSGYKLRVNPNNQKLELLSNDVLIHSVKYEWSAGQWTYLHLQVRELPGRQWSVEGKVWQEKQTKPKTWTLQWTDTTTPENGQPSAWATPNPGKPIALDDIQLWITED
tara:strand:+ start:683 stop:1327 length:645 start_codon:yes stop_codon:yes gene_type:complete